MNKTLHAFFALVRAGLWEQDVKLLPFGEIDFTEVKRLAEEQSVVGPVAAGLEHVTDVKIPKDVALHFACNALLLERRNTAMNVFIASLIEMLQQEGIYTLLVKGQGIAQCYERPLWRAAGDVDLFLNTDNYLKAIHYLLKLASNVDKENSYNKHLAMIIDSWTVELHGTLRTGLWRSCDRTIDDVQNDVFCGGNVRCWLNGNTRILLPNIDADVVFVFTHIIEHFYKEGVGLRQLCDWCRLLWMYGESINRSLLEQRLNSMGLMSEWKVFAFFVVNWLGMRKNAVPFYENSDKWRKKAEKVLDFIIETGNFGNNRDYSYYNRKTLLISKTISLNRHIKDTFRYFSIFPADSLRVMWKKLLIGFIVLFKGNKNDD